MHARPGPPRGLRRPAGGLARQHVDQHAGRNRVRRPGELHGGPAPLREQRVVHPGRLRGGHVCGQQPALVRRRGPVRVSPDRRGRHRGPQDRRGGGAGERDHRLHQQHDDRAAGHGRAGRPPLPGRPRHRPARPGLAGAGAGHDGRGGPGGAPPVRGQAVPGEPGPQLPAPAVDLLLGRLRQLLPVPAGGQAGPAPLPPRARRAAGQYRSSNGFCACPVVADIPQPQCLVPIEQNSPCSLRTTIRSLLGGLPVQSYVFPAVSNEKATRPCAMQLDWPIPVQVPGRLDAGAQWQEHGAGRGVRHRPAGDPASRQNPRPLRPLPAGQPVRHGGRVPVQHHDGRHLLAAPQEPAHADGGPGPPRRPRSGRSRAAPCRRRAASGA